MKQENTMYNKGNIQSFMTITTGFLQSVRMLAKDNSNDIKITPQTERRIKEEQLKFTGLYKTKKQTVKSTKEMMKSLFLINSICIGILKLKKFNKVFSLFRQMSHLKIGFNYKRKYVMAYESIVPLAWRFSELYNKLDENKKVALIQEYCKKAIRQIIKVVNNLPSEKAGEYKEKVRILIASLNIK